MHLCICACLKAFFRLTRPIYLIVAGFIDRALIYFFFFSGKFYSSIDSKKSNDHESEMHIADGIIYNIKSSAQNASS